jgi:hypothetical protein
MSLPGAKRALKVQAALPSRKLEVIKGQSQIAMITAPYVFPRLVIGFLAS